MKSPFLLVAGDQYYPERSDGDWVGFFDTYEEALTLVAEVKEDTFFSRGPRKGEVKSSKTYYKVDGRKRDWYEIINIETWTPS